MSSCFIRFSYRRKQNVFAFIVCEEREAKCRNLHKPERNDAYDNMKSVLEYPTSSKVEDFLINLARIRTSADNSNIGF